MKLKIKLVDDNAILPVKGTEHSACYDMFSPKDVVINPNDWVLIPSGLIMDIPKGYHVEIYSRSGLAAKKGVFSLISPGIIDEDYTGEVGMCLFNATSEPYFIKKGDRVSQFRLVKTEDYSLELVDNIKTTKRGDGGFGSTGF